METQASKPRERDLNFWPRRGNKLDFHHCGPSESPQSAHAETLPQQDGWEVGLWAWGQWELNGSCTLAKDPRPLALLATFSVTFR